MFEKLFSVGWGDLDANAHMRNTAYLDRAVDTRMWFFAEHGFPAAEFAARGLGPVVRRDELEYFKEIRLLETLRVTLFLAGLAPDGSQFRIRNEFWRGSDGQLAARLTSTGGWLDLKARKLTAPPEALLTALQALARADDFERLPSSLKPGASTAD